MTISVDTRSSIVAGEAVRAGADLINDVSAGSHDPAMVAVSAATGRPMVFMHSRGNPETMTGLTEYNDPFVDSVSEELGRLLSTANEKIPRWMQLIDPGIGFAKTNRQNLQLLHPENLKKFKSLLGNRPLLLGASRKRFIKNVLEGGPDISESDLDLGTYSACCSGILGGTEIVRVHNVQGARKVCDVTSAIVFQSDYYETRND